MAAGRYVTAEMIEQCQSMARRRIARQQIAHALGIHKSTVSRILDRTVQSSMYRRTEQHMARRAAAVSKAHKGPRTVDAIEYAREHNEVAKLIRRIRGRHERDRA